MKYHTFGVIGLIKEKTVRALHSNKISNMSVGVWSSLFIRLLV